MRLGHRVLPTDELKRFNADLERAIDVKPVKTRVCGEHCNLTCPGCGSTKCQCQCSPNCARAAQALSEEPDRYPIEPGVLPLVFEMKRVGIFEPCWSCEGHAAQDGSIAKLPSLWFYSESLVHIRLFASALSAYRYAGKLSAPWRVSVTYSDEDNPRSTFALEPVLAAPEQASLHTLQVDLGEIARGLEPMLVQEASRVRRSLRR